MTPTQKNPLWEPMEIRDIDIVAIEREARRMQARVIAQGVRAGARWIAAKVAAALRIGGQPA